MSVCVTNKKIHYRLTRKGNRKVNESQVDITPDQIDDYMQEALNLCVYAWARRSEIDQSYRKNLQLLERKNVSGKVVETKEKYTVISFPEDYWYKLRTVVIGSRECNGCKKCNGRELKAVYTQSSDLNEVLRSPYTKSSFDYEEAIVDEGEAGLYVFHNGDFKVDSVYFDYYRKPKSPKTPTLKTKGVYVDSSGVVNEDICFELVNSFQLDQVVDVADLLIQKDRGSSEDFQVTLNQILFKENIKNV